MNASQSSSNSSAIAATAAPHRASGLLAAACLVLAVLLPLGSIYFMTNGWPNALLDAIGNAAPGNKEAVLAAGGSMRLIVAAIIGLIPVGLMSYAMVIAYQCFSSFARGNYFTAHVVRTLRQFSRAMFAAAIACTVVPTLIVLILTSAGPGQTSLVLSLGSNHLVLLLFAAVVWQISRVMAKAVEIAEENAQFV